MSMESEIRKAIERDFAPKHLEIINESHKHIGHAGHDGSGESHFILKIVSDFFEGQDRIKRHRAINESLESLFGKGLHAISVKAFTENEWLGH